MTAPPQHGAARVDHSMANSGANANIGARVAQSPFDNDVQRVMGLRNHWDFSDFLDELNRARPDELNASMDQLRYWRRQDAAPGDVRYIVRSWLSALGTSDKRQHYETIGKGVAMVLDAYHELKELEAA